MNSDLVSHAIELRKQGKFEESRSILFSLVDSFEDKGSIYLNIAWLYDNQGMEKDALNYYALSLKEKCLMIKSLTLLLVWLVLIDVLVIYRKQKIFLISYTVNILRH